jgi:hypothetical protein
MLNKFEIKHAFSFDGGIIYEIKDKSLSSNVPKYKRFQWIMIYRGTRRYLKFKSSTETTRTFNKDVFLDMDNMIIKWTGIEEKIEIMHDTHSII